MGDFTARGTARTAGPEPPTLEAADTDETCADGNAGVPDNKRGPRAGAPRAGSSDAAASPGGQGAIEPAERHERLRKFD